jgi:hypothetical protein
MQIRTALERRRQREYVRAHGILLEMEVERCTDVDRFVEILRFALARLDLSLCPAEGLTPLHLGTILQKPITFYRPIDDGLREEWQFRGEMLEPALQRALERWGSLPGITAKEEQTLSPASPNKVPPSCDPLSM